MPVSDDLSKLSVRAKEAEGRVTAAPEKAKADLEEDLEFTRAAVEKQNAVLRELVSESKGRMSDRWHDLQAAWNEAISARGDREPQGRARPAQGGGAGRQGGGGRPVRDRLAYSAIVEAEYAALDAALARVEADELSNQAGATA